MENCRKNIFLIGLFVALSMTAYAQTSDEVTPVQNAAETVEAQPVAQTESPSVKLPPQAPKAAAAMQSSEGSQAATVSQAPRPSASPAFTAQPQVSAQTPPPVKLSGVVEISGFKYPVYLYIPRDYRTDRTYSLIMIAPAESMRTKEQMDYLEGLAQRRSIFILLPCVLWPKPGDTPYDLDTWLFAVKKEVLQRFPINPNRVYLVGKNTGGQYASYLATEHPQEFAAAALLGEAWNGSFEQLTKTSSEPEKQIPFFVALKAGTDAKARNQKWFDDLQKKGYLLRYYEYQKDEELDELEFKKEVYEWMEEANQTWAAAVAKSKQGWKAKFKQGIKDFFKV